MYFSFLFFFSSSRILKISSEGVLAYGSPWSGKHGLDTNICMPLKGICLLRRGGHNVIEPASSADCIGELLHQSFPAADPAGRQKVSSLVEQLVQLVPLWQMECTKDPAAALVSYEAMSK